VVRRRYDYATVDMIFGKYKGAIFVLIDGQNRAGLRYTYSIPGMGTRSVYCWDVEGFDSFIKKIERKHGGAKDEARMSGEDILALIKEMGIGLHRLAAMSGVSLSRLSHCTTSRTLVSKPATRKIREILYDYRKAKSKEDTASVPHLVGVRTEVGDSVRAPVRGDGKGQACEQGADSHPVR
jgi:hypothetical protein